MKTSSHLRIEPILLFWVNAGIPDLDLCDPLAAEPLSGKLQRLEELGMVMRHLDADGQIAWKASPSMLPHFAGLQRDAEDELKDDR
jgi:hypothetical protein